MADQDSGNEVTLGAQGRLVIPARLRRSLKLEAGDRLVARQVGDSLVLERREAIEKRLWAMFENVPPDVSLVDELIGGRRAEARKDDGT